MTVPAAAGLTIAVSLSILATPLHSVRGDVLDWAATAHFAHGVPHRMPERMALPVVAEVLTAFRKSGCHGTPWFHAEGLDESMELPTSGGLSLGEVTIQVPEYEDDLAPLRPESPVGAVGFHRPHGLAVLYATCTLAQIAGALLVFDTTCDRVVVVHPGDSPVELVDHWPW